MLLQNNLSPYGENKEDYSDLPPNQRKKKLQQRLEEIAAKIQQETAARFVTRPLSICLLVSKGYICLVFMDLIMLILCLGMD